MQRAGGKCPSTANRFVLDQHATTPVTCTPRSPSRQAGQLGEEQPDRIIQAWQTYLHGSLVITQVKSAVSDPEIRVLLHLPNASLELGVTHEDSTAQPQSLLHLLNAGDQNAHLGF